MYGKLFEKSFIKDSLQASDGLQRKEQIVSGSVSVILHEAGVIEVTPSEINDETYHLLITCSALESEASYLALLDSLINDILSGFQKVNTHCLFIVTNTDASHHLSDALLNQYVTPFWANVNSLNCLHLDITSGHHSSLYPVVAFSPKVRKPTRSRKLFDFLALSHIDAVVLHNAPIENVSWTVANQFEVDSAQIELPVTCLGSTERKNEGFELALRDFLAQDQSEHIPKSPKYFRVTRTIIKQHDDFRFLFSKDLPNFTRFKHGEVFGMDGDKPLMAKNDGEAVMYPNSTIAVGDVAAVMVFDVLPRYEDNQLIYD